MCIISNVDCKPYFSCWHGHRAHRVVHYWFRQFVNQSRCCHIGHCGDEPLVTQAHTRKWLGRARVGLTSQAAPESDDFPHQTQLVSTSCTAVARVETALLKRFSHKRWLGRWRAKPLLSHRECRLHPNGSVMPSGLTVTGSCVSVWKQYS